MLYSYEHVLSLYQGKKSDIKNIGIILHNLFEHNYAKIQSW